MVACGANGQRTRLSDITKPTSAVGVSFILSQATAWNHNTHFHRYLLRQFPQQVDRALDIGCGFGLFSQKLAERAKSVDALDVDKSSVERATQLNKKQNIRHLHTSFLEADLPEASYDVISSIASLHHMELEAALRKMKALLRPSGTIVILGLYREKTLADYIYSVISIPLNFICIAWHRSSTQSPVLTAPTRPAQLPLAQIRTVAKTLMPGCALRRHLFWRYSLIWQK